MLLDLEKLSVWCSLWGRDDACSSSDSDPVGICPCSWAAALGSVGGSGQAGPPAPAQGCRGARSSSLDEPWAALQAGLWGALDAGLV